MWSIENHPYVSALQETRTSVLRSQLNVARGLASGRSLVGPAVLMALATISNSRLSPSWA